MIKVKLQAILIEKNPWFIIKNVNIFVSIYFKKYIYKILKKLQSIFKPNYL